MSLGCPRCRDALKPLSLAGHYERRVLIDYCSSCRFVWFDDIESVQLSGLGWIDLLDRVGEGASPYPELPPQPLGCPLCSKKLVASKNQTRYGRFVAQRCPQGHGCLQSLPMLLAERGLVRAPTRPEQHAMAREGEQPCLNCGAPLPAKGDFCTHCRTPLLMFDLPRLADSLEPNAQWRDNVRGGRLDAWACHGCGHALDPTRHADCPQCAHPVLARTVADLGPTLAVLREQWQVWLAQPRQGPARPAGPERLEGSRRQRWSRQQPEKPAPGATPAPAVDGVPLMTSAAAVDRVPLMIWLGFGVLLAGGWGWLLW